MSCRPVSLQGHDVHVQFKYIFNLWKIGEIFHLMSIHAVSPVQDIFFGTVEQNDKKNAKKIFFVLCVPYRIIRKKLFPE